MKSIVSTSIIAFAACYLAATCCFASSQYQTKPDVYANDIAATQQGKMAPNPISAMMLMIMNKQQQQQNEYNDQNNNNNNNNDSTMNMFMQQQDHYESPRLHTNNADILQATSQYNSMKLGDKQRQSYATDQLHEQDAPSYEQSSNGSMQKRNNSSGFTELAPTNNHLAPDLSQSRLMMIQEQEGKLYGANVADNNEKANDDAKMMQQNSYECFDIDEENQLDLYHNQAIEQGLDVYNKQDTKYEKSQVSV